MRVAFSLRNQGAWTGGSNYIYNLLLAINDTVGTYISPVLFVDEGVSSDQIARFSKLAEIVPKRTLTSHRRFGLIQALSSQCDWRSYYRFEKKNIDLVFQIADWYGMRFPIPTLGWLPDFQHRHLPKMFRTRAWLHRELGYRMMALDSDQIMVSSVDAKNDCLKFYPCTRDKISVVPFSIKNKAIISNDAIVALKEKYQIHGNYFFLPNQLWKHKNHGIVIKALSAIAKTGLIVQIIATGNPAEPRDPLYPSKLLDSARNLPPAVSFRFLGLVPYDDIPVLMSGSLGLINPSLFEGWSTTVEEAKALGIPLILSDIPVHKEQVPHGGHFFDPEDPMALAKILISDKFFNAIKNLNNDELRANQDIRWKLFGENFLKAANRAILK